MSTADEEVVRRYYEQMVNERKIDLVGELFADDYKWHDPQSPGVSGPGEMAAMVSAWLKALDGHSQIEDIFSADDKVTVRWTGSGRHVGELYGVHPTGNPVEVGAISVHRVEGGKIAETWHLWDTLGFLRQLCVTPQQWQLGIASSAPT